MPLHEKILGCIGILWMLLGVGTVLASLAVWMFGATLTVMLQALSGLWKVTSSAFYNPQILLVVVGIFVVLCLTECVMNSACRSVEKSIVSLVKKFDSSEN